MLQACLNATGEHARCLNAKGEHARFKHSLVNECKRAWLREEKEKEGERKRTVKRARERKQAKKKRDTHIYLFPAVRLWDMIFMVPHPPPINIELNRKFLKQQILNFDFGFFYHYGIKNGR